MVVVLIMRRTVFADIIHGPKTVWVVDIILKKKTNKQSKNKKLIENK